MKEWSDNLKMENVTTPHGFASLAAAVVSQLQQYGKVFLYVDADGNILHKDPSSEIAVVSSPVLLVDPGQVELDEATESIRAPLSALQKLTYSGLILDEEK